MRRLQSGSVPRRTLVSGTLLAGLALTLVAHASPMRIAEAGIPVIEPPAAVDGRVRIPSFGVDAPLGVQQVASDGTMPMPYGPVDVAWYDFVLHPGLGGVPLTSGNTILSGHVDYAANVPYAGVRYNGPAVFSGLERLRPTRRSRSRAESRPPPIA